MSEDPLPSPTDGPASPSRLPTAQTWVPRCSKCNQTYSAIPKNWECPKCTIKVWEPDENASVCFVCKETNLAKFSRHHCRLCGRVVCPECSKYQQIIPSWGNDKHRCCSNCYIPSSPPILKGHLKKLGQRKLVFGDSFKQRWFELHEGVMLYYREPSGDLMGRIDLENARVVDVAMHRHAFCIMGPLLMRAFVFSADSADSKRRWVAAIEGAVTRGPKSSTGPVGSSLCGDGDGGDGGAQKLLSDGVSEVSLKDFELQTVLGLGSFGRVMKVKEKSTGNVYAMKVLEKAQIVANRMVTHTQAEKSILATIDHPFVVRLHYAFQTRHHLVFIMDFLAGGELFFHLQRSKRFPEARAKFYCAEIGLALDYIHSKNIVYRDLKPENLVLDRDGHVNLTDFGLAKKDVGDVTHTFCGTPEYMSPELILKRGHTKAVDWWSLGIFLYEMVYGLPPFYTKNVSDMYELILSKPLQFPSFFSPELRSLLTRLLDRDPKKRLQSGEEFKAHPWFADMDFGRLLRREIAPDFVPDLGGNELKYFDKHFLQESTNVTNLDQPNDPSDPTSRRFEGFNYSSPVGSPSSSQVVDMKDL
eukprot:PhM_4_TR3108/c0_g2_i1/m.23078/K13303/SGK2; serum/glucocorticoid-regulated kinase 2